MKNMMKIAAFALLILSVACIDARKTDGLISARRIVQGANGINQYFPGTWPFNTVEHKHVYSVFQRFNLPGYDKVRVCIFNTNAGAFGNYPLADWVQLSGTVLCKWVPAALILRAIYRKMTKKKKHKKRSGRRDEFSKCVMHS